MAAFSKLLTYCCCVHADPEPSLDEKDSAESVYVPYKDNPSDLPGQVVAKLLAAERIDAVLRADIQSTIHAYGWYDGLAAAVLAALAKAIESGKEMGPAMKASYERARTGVESVKAWAEAHPGMTAVVVTLIALGVLALMVPWLMAYLGFAEEGIIEASWAARWQATYQGFVPKGSLFSYLQSLGTKIGRKWLA